MLSLTLSSSAFKAAIKVELTSVKMLAGRGLLVFHHVGRGGYGDVLAVGVLSCIKSA
jgi:hypothetical protein